MVSVSRYGVALGEVTTLRVTLAYHARVCHTRGMTQTGTVEVYTLIAATGRKIRQATLVRFSDGSVVHFTEKMSKREALRQAEARR